MLPGELYHPHWHLDFKATFKSVKADLNIQSYLKNDPWRSANELDEFFRHVVQNTAFNKIPVWNNAWLDDVDFGRMYLSGVFPFLLQPVKLDSRNLPMERRLLEQLFDEDISFSAAVMVRCI